MRREASDQDRTPRQIVEDVLGARDTKELWGAGYRPALPITPQDFAFGSVLPAVLYMMRWGHRRGRGRFYEAYGQKPTIAQVAEGLSQAPELAGFEGEATQAVLGDLLLAFCLENRNRRTGRGEQVQRVFPTHYFASWIDLPPQVANLRGVPELVVTLLAQQPNGSSLTAGNSGFYAVGAGFEGNTLLRVFGTGAYVSGQVDDLRSDRFSEQTSLGVDQLLGVRLGRSLGEAPLKLRGENPSIANQLPAAAGAAELFYEDLNVFLRAYADDVPRQSLLPMLETGMAMGLSNIYCSTLHVMLSWEETGRLPVREDQQPWPLFVDCSMSTDGGLRRLSEESLDDLLQRLAHLPVILKCLQILDLWARNERLPIPEAAPDPAPRINYLGDLLFDRREESRDIYRDLRRTCNRLADELRQEGPDLVVGILEDEERHPAWRLAEGLVVLMGDGTQFEQFRKCLDSCLMANQPNGLCRRRRSTVRGRSADRRSLVLTNTVLDFLVHRHLRKAAKATPRTTLSLGRFVDLLRDRYGFYVSESPPGMVIPGELLQRNRAILERRLRDLGLFIGVNDAESMKRLQPRYEAEVRSND